MFVTGPKKQCLSKFGLVHFFLKRNDSAMGCRYEIWGILSLIDEVFFWQIGNPLKCSEGVWSFWFIETWNRRKPTSQISCISYLIDTISWFFRLPSSLVGSYKDFTRKIQLWLELELHHFKRPASWSSRITQSIGETIIILELPHFWRKNPAIETVETLHFLEVIDERRDPDDAEVPFAEQAPKKKMRKLRKTNGGKGMEIGWFFGFRDAEG